MRKGLFRYKYDRAYEKILLKYSKDYHVCKDLDDADEYMDKYSDLISGLDESVKNTLICYSGDYCEKSNDYLNNHLENESPKDYAIRVHRFDNAIVEKVLRYLYNYDIWIKTTENVLAFRYIYLNGNKFRTASNTIISCSLDQNILDDVFASNDYFNTSPYYMGKSDTLIIVLIKKDTRFLCYDPLHDVFALRQAEILLPDNTVFKIIKRYKIRDNQIKNIYIVEIK